MKGPLELFSALHMYRMCLVHVHYKAAAVAILHSRKRWLSIIIAAPCRMRFLRQPTKHWNPGWQP